MACKTCEYIADKIMCEDCSRDIVKSCDDGDCDADAMVEMGSVNGHPFEPPTLI